MRLPIDTLNLFLFLFLPASHNLFFFFLTLPFPHWLSPLFVPLFIPLFGCLCIQQHACLFLSPQTYPSFQPSLLPLQSCSIKRVMCDVFKSTTVQSSFKFTARLHRVPINLPLSLPHTQFL